MKKIFQEKCVTNILECFHEQNTPHAPPPPGYTLKHGQYENGSNELKIAMWWKISPLICQKCRIIISASSIVIIFYLSKRQQSTLVELSATTVFTFAKFCPKMNPNSTNKSKSTKLYCSYNFTTLVQITQNKSTHSSHEIILFIIKARLF